jgi:lipid-binding SYLF domain-containing protein
MRLRNMVWGVALCIVATGVSRTAFSAQSDEEQRVRASTVALNELTQAPDKAIPASVLDKAEAIAIFPGVKKAGFVIGGQWGRGLITVRDAKTRRWSSPAFLTMTGGSVGAQIGGEEVDIILVIMNRTGVEHLLSNEFKVGGAVSASAGPLGRAAEASTDLSLRAEILSYSRSRGLYAGATVNGSSIKEDLDANQRFYGKPLSSEDVVFEKMGTSPPSVDELKAALTRETR